MISPGATPASASVSATAFSTRATVGPIAAFIASRVTGRRSVSSLSATVISADAEVGQRDLRALDAGCRGMALPVADDVDHALDEVGAGGLVADLAQVGHRLVGVKQVDALPCGQVVVVANRQVALAVLRRRPVAQFRHQVGDAYEPVEIGAADMDAVARKDVVLALGRPGAVRRDADDREIGGSAADVDDEREFLARHLPLVVEGGGDRLELELDVAEAAPERRRLELPLRLAVGGGIAVDEVDRPAEHDVVDRPADMGLEALLEIEEERADDVGEGDRMGLDAGLFLDQRRAQHAFQRAQQPAFDIVGIAGDRGAAETGAVVLEIEEDGARHRHLAILQRDQPRPSVVDEADRRIGRAKVDPAARRAHGLSSELVWSRGGALIHGSGGRVDGGGAGGGRDRGGQSAQVRFASQPRVGHPLGAAGERTLSHIVIGIGRTPPRCPSSQSLRIAIHSAVASEERLPMWPAPTDAIQSASFPRGV